MVRIESQGSVWLFDEDAMTYLRLPKREAPRDTYGVLEDGVPLPYLSWGYGHHRHHPHLIIITPLGPIFAPLDAEPDERNPS